MLPGEAEKIAEYLGITLKELFIKYLAIDYYLSCKDGNKYLLSPAVKSMIPGNMVPANPMGECIFFDKESSKCKIHPVAPYECKKFIHGTQRTEIEERHKWVAEQWNNEKNYDQLVELYEKEPLVPKISMEDLKALVIHSIMYK